MDAATAIKIAKEARKVAKKVKELYELDQKKRIRVMRDIILGRFRDDIVFPDGSVRSVPDFWCDDFAIVDGVFEVFATGDRDPFCDGSSLAPDEIGSWKTIKAALGHDAGYEHLEEIAEAWGWTTEEVRWLFDAMFGNLLHAETERQKNAVMRVAGNAFEKIYYWAVRRFGGFYHSVKQAAPALLALLLVAGCLAIPDVFEPSDEQPEVAESQQVAVESSLPVVAESATTAASAMPWNQCKYSSNWDGNNAAKRMMNLVSPKFSDAKVKEYLDWQQSVGCDHCHLLLVNEADGEGAGYDALADASAKKTALQRVKQIRARGMGVVAWIVADDSDNYRKRIFNDPAKYANGLKDYMPYLSYICLGLEMNEGEGSSAKWTALRDAIKAAGWTGPFATHHTSGKYGHAGLGSIVMDQLDPSCTVSDIAKSVKALCGKGYEVCGFEYSRGPDKAKAQAALDAGAFGCGNWKGNGPIVTPSVLTQGNTRSEENNNQITTKEESANDKFGDIEHDTGSDAVDFASLDWCRGSFSGKSAKIVDGVQIGSLKVSSSGLSYKWVKGGCEKLGASSATDASCLACVFCLIDGKWKGGKADWVSTSRTTRDSANIYDGYNGWDKQAISKATAYAFVIVSKDGKKRTNVIKAGR